MGGGVGGHEGGTATQWFGRRSFLALLLVEGGGGR